MFRKQWRDGVSLNTASGSEKAYCPESMWIGQELGSCPQEEPTLEYHLYSDTTLEHFLWIRHSPVSLSGQLHPSAL